MATFLLTWNPRKWQWDSFEEGLELIHQNGSLAGRWSCRNKSILSGDRVFLLRQGLEPRGLISSGWALDGAYEDEHWDDAGPRSGSSWYVDVEWDSLSREPIITREELDEERFAGVNWNTQTSGIAIVAPAARLLEMEWGRRTGSRFEPIAEEILDAKNAGAGLATINMFERLAIPRARCIEHYGMRCVVCNFDYSGFYGESAEGLVQVHHLAHAETPNAYTIDPVRDLRPVCANCHTVLHRREPPYTIEEVKEMLEIGRAVTVATETEITEVDHKEPKADRASGHAEQPEPSLSSHGIRIDPVQETEAYLVVEADANTAARDDLMNRGIDPDGFGSFHAFCETKQRILREKFGIDWRTPAELNPSTTFD